MTCWAVAANGNTRREVALKTTNPSLTRAFAVTLQAFRTKTSSGPTTGASSSVEIQLRAADADTGRACAGFGFDRADRFLSASVAGGATGPRAWSLSPRNIDAC